MELSNEQRELLSAYLDGEVNASERALAQALLERAEAASYFANLKRVRELSQQHGAAKAPHDFAALVKQSLEGDFDGISRPTSNSGDYDGISRPTSNQAPIHALPQATWRMPLLAAAAAIVMALSIFAYNALVLPAAAPSEVALQHHNGAAPTVTEESPALAGDERNLDDHNEVPARDVETLKKSVDAGGTREEFERRARKKPAEDAQDSVEEKTGEGEGKKYAEKDAKSKDDDKNSVPEQNDKRRGESDGSGVGTGGGTGGGGGERRNDAEGKVERSGKTRANGAEPPAESPPAPAPPKAEWKEPPQGKPEPSKGENQPSDRPANPATEKAKEQAQAREVTIEVAGQRAADAPSLATDMLQVASVYGQAKAGADAGCIEIEVSEDQVEDMLAALNKLAKNEATAKDLSEPRTKKPDANKEEAERARDYLPPEKPETGAAGPERDAPKSAESAKKKVKVIVRLK